MERVLHIGFSPNYGGIETFLMTYYRKIDKSQFQFDFINPYDQIAFEDEIIAMGGKIYKTVDFHKNPVRYYKQLVEICKSYSIVHVHMLSAANILPLMAARRAGVKKIIAHSHNTQPEDRLRAVLHIINKRKLRKYTNLNIACSNEAGNWMFGKSGYILLKNAVETEKYKYSISNRNKVREDWNVDANTFVVGHVGRLNVQKNHEYLLKVFAEIKKVKENSKLILVGEGELEASVKEQALSYGIQDNVVFLGKRTDVDLLYNGFDVFVLPSLYEGLPVVLVEAQTNGLKCYVSSNVPEDCKLTTSLVFVSLSEGPRKWANIILADNSRNGNAVYEIQNAGFDIKNSVSTLLSIYKQTDGE